MVYGSCARGDAGARSDIDILLYTDGAKKSLESLVDLAHEASLGTGRSPDVRIIQAKDWRTADAAFRANIGAEGITVYSTDPNAALPAVGTGQDSSNTLGSAINPFWPAKKGPVIVFSPDANRRQNPRPTRAANGPVGRRATPANGHDHDDRERQPATGRTEVGF